MKEEAPDKNNRWVKIFSYFCIVAGFGLVASLLAALIITDSRIDLPSPGTTGIRANLVIGACAAMLACPVLAGIRYWNIFNYLISSILALGLLSGNIGTGLVMALVSALIYYGAQKVFQILGYFGLK